MGTERREIRSSNVDEKGKTPKETGDESVMDERERKKKTKQKQGRY